MKVKVIIFCILFAQTSASFFDAFRGAMSSVEYSFGKLLTDVVTDVRDTIGCTILAVKQVLALGGILHESAEYDARCNLINHPASKVHEEKQVFSPTPPLILATTPPPTKSDGKSITEILSDQIEESIKNVNPDDIIGKKNTHEKLDSVTNSLLQESARLVEVSGLLSRELSDISEDVKKQISKVQTHIDNPNSHDIWNEINTLHNIELSNMNTPKATVIHHILNEVLSVLHGHDNDHSDKTTVSKSAKETDLNDTFMQLKQDFLNIEKEESQELNAVKDVLKKDVNNESRENGNYMYDFPTTFKDVAKKIMDDTRSTLRFSDSQENKELPSGTTESTTTMENNEGEVQPDEYGDLFLLAPKGSAEHQEAVQSAKELIEKSKQTDAIMDSLFNKASDVGLDVFESPDLLDFGM